MVKVTFRNHNKSSDKTWGGSRDFSCYLPIKTIEAAIEEAKKILALEVVEHNKFELISAVYCKD